MEINMLTAEKTFVIKIRVWLTAKFKAFILI